MNEKLINLMADLMEDETIALVKDLIAQARDPMDILDDARSAMEIVGKRFESCEYFIPDLMMAGEILRGISDIVKPLLEKESRLRKEGQGPDRHRGRRHPRHRQGHRHLHARRLRLRRTRHRHRRAGRHLRREDKGIQSPGRRLSPAFSPSPSTP